MKIAINTLPLKNAHKTRGIGYYTNHLIAALRQLDNVEISEFSKLAEIKNADIIHYPWFDLFFHSLPMRKQFSTIVTVHDVMPLRFPKNYPLGLRGKINFLMQKIALSSCKSIITDSEVSKKDIVKYLKVEDKKITVVPLAADERFKILNDDTKLLYVKRKYHLSDRMLLYVGDANQVKNLPFLIEGFRQLLLIPGFTDIKLVLIGGVFLKNVDDIDHPELASLRSVNNLIKQYRLEESVVRPGQIEDDELVAFYNLATVYVQPSIYEGFGLPVLEAFACGTPVVSSNRGSLPEVGGQAALYFDPTNMKQFISLIKEVLGDKSLQNKLSKLGLIQAAKFSWEKVAINTKLVYIKAINNE